MDELPRALILIFTGWFLGVLTTSVENWRKSQHEYRTLFGRCYRIAEELAIDLAISEEWTRQGLIQGIDELFVGSESNKVTLPPSPPHLPKDFNDVLNRLFEYEATRSKSKFGKQFVTIHNWVNILRQVYAGLKAVAEASNDPLPDRAMDMYKDTWNELREYLKSVIQDLNYQRSPYLARLFKVIRRKLRQSSSSETQKSKDQLAQ